MSDTAIKEHRNVDQYSDVELAAAFWKYFGGRGVGIIGWCTIGSLSGASDPSTLRKEMERRGLSQTALYHALDSLREFQEHLEGQPLPRRDSSYALNLLKRLSAVTCL